jgi:hypothetical protein
VVQPETLDGQPRPGSIKDLARITHNRIKSMQYQPDLITGFLASTGLRPP